MTELLNEATAEDLALASLVAFVIGFIAVWLLSRIFEFFVGLKSPPTKRAALTVGSAYLIVAVALIILVPIDYSPVAALVPIPGSIAWFLYIRSHFKRAWYEDSEELPDGVELATDSWVDGLLYFALTIVVTLGVVLFRYIRDGVLGSI